MPRGIPATFPNRRQLRHWERVCCYLDSQPYRAVKHPFPDDPSMSVKLFKRMARYKLARHYETDCSYRLSQRWRAILRRLWQQAPEEETIPESHPLIDPFIADAGPDTYYVNLLTPPPPDDPDVDDPRCHVPAKLIEQCEQLRESARLLDKKVDSPWLYFGVLLSVWKSGIGSSAEKKGISWSYLLMNSLITIRLRKVPLGGIVGSIRFGAEVLWQYGARAALDEAARLIAEIWQDDTCANALTWQVSQIHLCVDVANFHPTQADLQRVCSHSRRRVVHVPSLNDEQATFADTGDDDGLYFDAPDDWEDLPAEAFLMDDDASEDDTDEDDDDIERDPDDEQDPADEDGAAIHLFARKVSGFHFSPGAPLSASWYDKDLQERLTQKPWMRPIHEAGGWQPWMSLFRVEFRARRDILREIEIALGQERGRWCTDPWLMLEHFQDLWAYFVGLPASHDLAPDVTHRGWLRLAVPTSNEDRSTWPTDPVWQVIQCADFGQQTPPTPLQRRKMRFHDPKAIDAEIYGLLKLRSVVHGRQMDTALTLSQEIGNLYDTLEEWDELKGREFSEEVREKARLLGRAVPLRDPFLLPPSSAAE